MNYENYNKIIPFRYFYYMKKNKIIEFNERYMFYLKEKININNNINEACKIRKNYLYTYYIYKKYYYILKNLPEDIIQYITLYDIIPTCNNVIIPFYNIVQKKIDIDKIWYILISNILFTIKNKYHLFVLDICKKTNYTFIFENDLDIIISNFGYIPNLITDGILFDSIQIYDNDIISKCNKYKKYINFIIKSTYDILMNGNSKFK